MAQTASRSFFRALSITNKSEEVFFKGKKTFGPIPSDPGAQDTSFFNISPAKEMLRLP